MQNITIDFSDISHRVEATDGKEMLSWYIDENTKKLTYKVNNSSIDIMRQCWRKTFYTLVEGWRSRSQSVYVEFGKAIHKAMEVYHSYPLEERVWSPHYRQGLMSMAGGDTGEGLPDIFRLSVAAFFESAPGLFQLDPHERRSWLAGAWTLSHYFQTYENCAYEIYRDEKGPFIERRIEFPIWESGEFDIVGFATLDQALIDPYTKEVMGADFKTSGQMKSYMSKINPNDQYTFYLIALSHELDFDVSDFLVDLIEVKPVPKTARGGPPNFIRQPTKRSKAQKEELKNEIIDWICQFHERYKTQKAGCATIGGQWPKGAGTACVVGYSECQYHDVCANPPEFRENMLNMSFDKGGVKS